MVDFCKTFSFDTLPTGWKKLGGKHKCTVGTKKSLQTSKIFLEVLNIIQAFWAITTNLIQCCMFDSKILNTKGIFVGQNVSKNNTGWFLRYLKLNCCVVQLHIGPLGEPRINKILGGLNIFIACKKQGHRISMAKSVGKKSFKKLSILSKWCRIIPGINLPFFL